jgi:hypothetical protein
MGVNFLLFYLGILKGTDLSDLGSGLALVNTPIVTWIIGESIRPTGYKNNNINKNEQNKSKETGGE